MLQLKNIKKSFKGVEVLKGISISFESPGLYGVVGPNGAGKTTLMKCILNLIDCEGDVIFGRKNYRESISHLPEIITTYPYLTGEEVIDLLISIQEKDRDRVWSNVELLAKDLNYIDFKKLILQHSKGNLRKLFLIYALSVESEYIFLDEPFAGLDPISVELVKKTLVYHKSTSLIILNTHFFDSAKEICDRIYFLKSGNILKVAERDEIKDVDIVRLYGKGK